MAKNCAGLQALEKQDGSQVVIGIDPDLDQSGLAVWVDGVLVELLCLSLLQLLPWLLEKNEAGAVFVLEDVEANKPVFQRKGQNRRQMMRIAQNVGQVKAIARQIKQALEQMNADFMLVRPLQGVMKKPKKDAGLFNKMTGWKGRSNEDKRDAGMLGLYAIRGGRGTVVRGKAA